jgi:GNAT superfamily N-acetyltransferase
MADGGPRLTHLLRLPGGEAVIVRPARPEDAGRLQAYVRSLSPEARYNRFLGAVNELPAADLAHIGDPDEGRAMLIAESGRNGARSTIGEARYAVAPDGSGGEFALSVAEAWRGKGLGTLLMAEIECRARDLGVAGLAGDVLRTNVAMQRLARKAGFALSGVPRESRLVRVVKDIARTEAAPPCREFAAQSLPIAA